MKKGLILSLTLILLGSVLGNQYTGTRKSLIEERKFIDTAWNELDTAIEHRAEIVPSLTQFLRDEAPDETKAIQSLADARESLRQARGLWPKVGASTALDGAVANAMLCIENYPKLENSKKYRHLLDTLKEAEYRFALARRKYNEAVEHYNTRVSLFPTNIVASVSRFGKIDAYFPTPADATKPSKLEY